MYELVQAGERTYYINSPAKIGLYLEGERDVYLIDSGNDKDAGRKVKKLLEQNGWELRAIINTHSNADHIGGNRFLQERYHCKVLGTGLENAFTRYPLLEPSFLYGGYPCKELKNKFLMAQPSEPQVITPEDLPAGMELMELPGHFFEMIGLRTPDDVWFLADCLVGEETLCKYHVSFIYDVRAYLETLERVEQLEGKLFIPAHMQAVEDIRPAVQRNREKVHELLGLIESLCGEPLVFEQVLKGVFDHFKLRLDWSQYVLAGSTVRSYLSYLYDEGRVVTEVQDNLLLWKRA